MKRNIYWFIITPIFLLSCQKTPEAFFHIDSSDPEVGEKILFMNDSHNAVKFDWDFGDGTTTNERSPSHIYTGTGSYDVVMMAISKKGLEARVTMIIDVKIPTLLEIEVREYYQQYAVANATVTLYSTLPDWDAQTGAISQGVTDADGITVFSNLDPFVYYVDVWEQNYDNYTLKNESVDYIRTPEILPHKINRFVAWVDSVPHTKRAGIGARSLIVRKLERKPADRIQQTTDLGTEGWQKVYDRRVVKK